MARFKRRLARIRRPHPRFRKYFHRRKNRKLPILPLVGLAPPAINFVNWVKDPLMRGDLQGACYNGAYSLARDFTGFDLNTKQWSWEPIARTYTGVVLGLVGHKLAQKFGLNRTIERIPLLGKYIEL